jgi:hypothetical protein
VQGDFDLAGEPITPIMAHREDSKPANVQHSQSKISVGFYAVGHFVCSSCLLVITKWTLLNFAHAFALAVLQLSFVSSAIFLMKFVRVIDLDLMGFSMMKQHLPASAMFLLVVCASNSILVLSDLNTLIFVLCTAPLLHSLFDIVVQMLVSGTTAPMRSAFLVRCWRSSLALLTILIGVTMFVVSNSSAVAAGFSWILIYYVCSLVYGILNKNVLNDLQLSPWSNVFYNNSLALFAVPLAVFCAGEWSVFRYKTYEDVFYVATILPLLICFAVGLGAIFFEMNIHKVPRTALAVPLVGVLCRSCVVILGRVFLSDNVSIVEVLGIFVIIISCFALEVFVDRLRCRASAANSNNKLVPPVEENILRRNVLPAQQDATENFVEYSISNMNVKHIARQNLHSEVFRARKNSKNKIDYLNQF